MYRGESIAKKFARNHFWSLRNNKKLSEPGRKILIFASSEGGDASCLLGYGIPPENIVAIDMDSDACAEFNKKYPMIECINTTAEQLMVEKPRQKYDVVYLDFCGILNDKTSKIVLEYSRYTKGMGILAATFLKGRDPGNKYIPGDLANMGSVKKFRELLIINGENSPEANAFIRANRIQMLSAKRASFACGFSDASSGLLSYGDQTTLWIEKIITYNSTSPMMTAVYRCVNARRFTKERYELYLKKFNKLGYADEGSSDVNRLRRYVLDNSKDSSIHLKMNIPKMKVAAWKAHQTMGTYNG